MTLKEFQVRDYLILKMTVFKKESVSSKLPNSSFSFVKLDLPIFREISEQIHSEKYD